MDSSNFSSYRSGRQHRYFGGLITHSPVRLVVPNSGNWHVTVDMRGLRGTTRSSVRTIPVAALSPLPEYRPSQPLSALVRSGGQNEDDSDTSRSVSHYDVFISHAAEDKDDIVRPLATALVEKG